MHEEKEQSLNWWIELIPSSQSTVDSLFELIDKEMKKTMSDNRGLNNCCQQIDSGHVNCLV